MNYRLCILACCFAWITTAHAQTQQLNILTYDAFVHWGPGTKIADRFSQRCNCQINWITVDDNVNDPSALLLQHLRNHGEDLRADVIIGLDNQHIADALATGLIATLAKPVNTRFGSSDNLVPFNYGYLVFIKKATNDIPDITSLDALAQMDDDLTIGIEDPRHNDLARALLAWVASQHHSPETFWRQIQPKIRLIVPENGDYNLFDEGRMDLMLTLSMTPIYEQMVEQDNSSVAILFDHPHYEYIQYAAALSHASHSDLAEAFLHELLTPQTQQIIALNHWMYPVIEDIDLPTEFTAAPKPAGATLSPTRIAQELPQWLAMWQAARLAEWITHQD